MPFKIVKDPKKGYYVMDTNGKKYSRKPLSLARAKRQLAALHIHTGHGLIEGGIADDGAVGNQVFPRLVSAAGRYKILRKFSEDDMLIGDNILTGGKVRFSDHKTFVQWLNTMFYELLTKPISERNNLFKARTEIRSGLPSWDESERTFIVYDRAGKYLSLKTYPIEKFDEIRRYFMNRDNETEWGFPFIETDYNALKRDKPLDADGVWRSRTGGIVLYFTRIPTSLEYPMLGTPSSSPSGSPKAKSSSSSPREGPVGFAPGTGPVSLVSASEMAGGPPPPVPGTEGPKARKFREHVMKLFGWSEEKVKEHPVYQGYLKRGEGKVKFVKKYLKGQGLPATKKNVAKVCDIMNSEGIVFEATKK